VFKLRWRRARVRRRRAVVRQQLERLGVLVVIWKQFEWLGVVIVICKQLQQLGVLVVRKRLK